MSIVYLFDLCLFSTSWFSLILVYVVLQQENNAKSLSSAQETQSSLPPNVRHSPQNQDPVVSPPTNEDLWHLPGRLSESAFRKIQFSIV